MEQKFTNFDFNSFPAFFSNMHKHSMDTSSADSNNLLTQRSIVMAIITPRLNSSLINLETRKNKNCTKIKHPRKYLTISSRLKIFDSFTDNLPPLFD